MFWMAMAMAINGKPLVIIRWFISGLMIQKPSKMSTTYSWPNGDPIHSSPPQDVKNLDGSIPGPYPDDGDEGGGHQDPAIAMRKIDGAWNNCPDTPTYYDPVM